MTDTIAKTERRGDTAKRQQTKTFSMVFRPSSMCRSQGSLEDGKTVSASDQQQQLRHCISANTDLMTVLIEITTTGVAWMKRACLVFVKNAIKNKLWLDVRHIHPKILNKFAK